MVHRRSNPYSPYAYIELQDFYSVGGVGTAEAVAGVAVHDYCCGRGSKLGAGRGLLWLQAPLRHPPFRWHGLAMIHAILLIILLLRKMVNMTIVQDTPTFKALLVDKVDGELSI